MIQRPVLGVLYYNIGARPSASPRVLFSAPLLKREIKNAPESIKITTALLTIIYSRDGKKIYSKIYYETLEKTASSIKFSFYTCTMKLLENQGEQINKDLSFLLTANIATSPTLEDLHMRLQQPGTIDDDVKYLKGLQGK